ncbi:MAG: hypothetical protein WKI04_03455 [Ferruginibacter sp.]
MKRYYFKQESGYDYLTTYSIKKASADIMVFGSSRAVNIFNTEIFEEKLGVTCYNAGRYGEPVFYHYAVLKTVLKRGTPKLAILSMDAGNFSNNPEAYDRITALLPYYQEHPEIRPVVELKGPYEKLKMLSNIYPYNSLILPIITGNSEYSKKKYLHIKGFIPLKRIFDGPLRTFDYSKEKDLDTVKINAYRSFITDCIHAKVQLFIICSPYMINAIGTDRSIREAKKIAQEYNIKFLDYSQDSSYTTRPELFADYRHLNEDGVKAFNNTIIDQISIEK